MMDARSMSDKELAQVLTLATMSPALAHLADELRGEAARRQRGN
jgi:hypothetical protein